MQLNSDLRHYIEVLFDVVDLFNAKMLEEIIIFLTKFLPFFS